MARRAEDLPVPPIRVVDRSLSDDEIAAEFGKFLAEAADAVTVDPGTTAADELPRCSCSRGRVTTPVVIDASAGVESVDEADNS